MARKRTMIDHLAAMVADGFQSLQSQLGERFLAVDSRFLSMDNRFDAMESRFLGIENELKDLKSQVGRMERKLDSAYGTA